MADTQYDVSPKILRLFHEKQKIRESIRQTILKHQTSPNGGSFYPLDNAVIRYHALFGYRNEHVRPTPRNVSVLFCTLVLPVGLLYYDIMRHHERKEKLIRSGKVAYEDRCFKSAI